MKSNEVTVKIIDKSAELGCSIKIKGQEIPCSHELYLSYHRQSKNEKRAKYRNKRPFINGKRCQGDCSNCVCFEGGECQSAGVVSLDALPEDSSYDPVATTNVEEEAALNITIESMYKELENEDERCRDIFTLMIREIPQRQIASELGIADGTVTYYIKKIRKRLEKFR